MLNFTTGSTPAVPTVNGTKFVAVEGDLGTSVTVEWSENGTDKWVPLVSEVNTPAALTVAQGVLYVTAAGYVRLTMVGTGNCNYAISDIRQR
tara:strand:- start:4 stop:279 length:276 start_codon:yes stop_codon:yes gene_type:complete